MVLTVCLAAGAEWCRQRRRGSAPRLPEEIQMSGGLITQDTKWVHPVVEGDWCGV